MVALLFFRRCHPEVSHSSSRCDLQVHLIQAFADGCFSFRTLLLYFSSITNPFCSCSSVTRTILSTTCKLRWRMCKAAKPRPKACDSWSIRSRSSQRRSGKYLPNQVTALMESPLVPEWRNCIFAVDLPEIHITTLIEFQV